MALTETTYYDEGAVPEWTLGNRILRARQFARLEQSDLATSCGVSRPLISKWERDLAEPRASQLQRIAEVCEVSYGWLIGIRTGSFSWPFAVVEPDMGQGSLLDENGDPVGYFQRPQLASVGGR